jgi:hypothetical protein
LCPDAETNGRGRPIRDGISDERPERRDPVMTLMLMPLMLMLVPPARGKMDGGPDTRP